MAQKNKITPGTESDPGREIDLSPTRKFVVKRTGKQIARMQQRIKIASIATVALLVLVIILYLLFFLGDKGGDFTVKLDAGSRKMASLSETEDFANPTVILEGTNVADMWHCTESWIPTDIYEHPGGSHNSDEPSYMAYTFYFKNQYDGDIEYTYTINFLKQKLAVDEALRIKVYKNGESEMYGKKQKGKDLPDPVAVPFIDESTYIRQENNKLKKGATDKFTVVMWLEGEDPECINDIIGGFIHLDMQFSVKQDKK